MTKATLATPHHPLYCLDELTEKRRNILRYARTFPPGAERNQLRQIAVSRANARSFTPHLTTSLGTFHVPATSSTGRTQSVEHLFPLRGVSARLT
jgi:hypothetical protein